MRRAPMLLFRALAVACLVGGLRAQQPLDYPAATAPTAWANTDAALPHHVVYTDGSVARAALLRLNPARYGPSFAFGFFCANHRDSATPCTQFLLGVAVVYCNSGAGMTFVTAGVPQVVWSANRRSPVGNGAVAELTKGGDLVLRSSAGGAVLWSSGTAGRSVAGVRIDNNGNLVLFDGRNSAVWQSFDHPTDVLLVGQSLRHGARLTANVSAADWRESRLYLAVDDDGLSGYVHATPRPQRYYRRGFGIKAAGAYATYTNGSLTVLARPGAPPLTDIQLPAVGAGTVQYMRLEYDGHLRLYEWRTAAPGWVPVADVLQIFPDDCAYPTVCGAYGVCTEMQCSCPDAANFRPVDFRRPNRGCVPTKRPPLSCASPRPRVNHRLVSLPDTTYFNDHATSMRALARVSQAACKKACLHDCACAAAQFYYGPDAGDGFCYLQSEVFSMQTLQPAVVHYNSTMHIKVQA